MWSLQNMDDFKKLDTSKLFAVEIYNHGTSSTGYKDTNENLYDDFLRLGHKVYCTATDDNHNGELIGTPGFDSLGGFVMIKASALTYENIFNALKLGNFYASNGPEINEIYIEDEQLVVKTSPAVKVTLNTPVRYAKCVYPQEVGGVLNEARFELVLVTQSSFVSV